MITKYHCICGANKPEDGKEYDGMLGYEAIVCKKCGRVHDQTGTHDADEEFSLPYVGLTKETAARIYTATEALIIAKSAMAQGMVNVHMPNKKKDIDQFWKETKDIKIID